MGLPELFFDFIEGLYWGLRRMFCSHDYHSGWRDMITDEPKKVCHKCNKKISVKGGIPKLDTPILSEEDVKDLND